MHLVGHHYVFTLFLTYVCPIKIALVKFRFYGIFGGIKKGKQIVFPFFYFYGIRFAV
jgi:hypothetical protein